MTVSNQTKASRTGFIGVFLLFLFARLIINFISHKNDLAVEIAVSFAYGFVAGTVGLIAVKTAFLFETRIESKTMGFLFVIILSACFLSLGFGLQLEAQQIISFFKWL